MAPKQSRPAAKASAKKGKVVVGPSISKEKAKLAAKQAAKQAATDPKQSDDDEPEEKSSDGKSKQQAAAELKAKVERFAKEVRSKKLKPSKELLQA
eukprot:6788146-Alexandrium_andersonii.AAC.1